MALPVIAAAGILRVLFPEKERIRHWLDSLLGLGFLFYGLDMMRLGMEDSIQKLNLSSFVNLPLLIYPLAGLVITVLTQSSAATVAIVLSALNAKAIDLHIATAVVLGSEVGTTLKLVLAAAGKEPSMKRVALGNLTFNITTMILIFSFLSPVNYFITSVIGITTPLLALAAFQTLTNLAAVALFFPLLGGMARLLNKRFRDSGRQTRYIGKVAVENEELAIAALERETLYFLKVIIQYCLRAFDKEDLDDFNGEMPPAFSALGSADRYRFIKQLHGDMYAYGIALQNTTVRQEQTVQLSRLIASARNGMYAAKSIKDAEADISQLRSSGNNTKYQFYLDSKETTALLLGQLAAQLQTAAAGEERFSGLVQIYRTLTTGYNDRLQTLYGTGSLSQLSDIEISTIINFNREVYSAFKSLVYALKDVQLTGEEARYFDELPGFIR